MGSSAPVPSARLLWFGTDYGTGDPLRWSPVAVEILLLDWVPRKLAASAAYLSKIPGLVRALVRYAHAERSIPGESTRLTLAMVDECEEEYQNAIRTPRHQGPMALLERMGALDGAEQSIDEYMLGRLTEEVGGPDPLDQLSVEPLPDETFDWTGIPDDTHPRVEEVRTLVDECSDALFDGEFRTAARRFLSRVAASDPAIFRRKSSARMSAAAVCWTVGKANGSFELYAGPGVQVQEMMAHLGVKGSASQRAEVMLRALGVGWRYGRTSLGDPVGLVYLLAAAGLVGVLGWQPRLSGA